ncbi:hypothetical protein K6119_10855 [Paracrocinitomix mangrovi]|uniref:hypothetical protein n=1 Tax=Paracrocinitomix mangrovi TaxID=2862509 RepID=UPI001C8D9DE7|nr:hypothetical protein [Paracrocinitomix mangrovi]UKN00232.1 hypothetical protein K6119_10855 [Paracrocinitomix mangrovi]
MNVMYTLSDRIFDYLKEFWESKTVHKATSTTFVVTFILGILAYSLGQFVEIPFFQKYFNYPFVAIELAFTLLLLTELLSLIFTLPKSVAQSVTKQFELLSLIYLRSAFKEFSQIHHLSEWSLDSPPLFNMFVYGGGALAIFAIIGFTLRLQKHIRITKTDKEQQTFIQSKKLLSLLLLISFIVIGVFDAVTFITTGKYPHSFNLFYTMLVFSDIIIVLIALRYSLSYIRIFRYSAFVLATIFIRISLSMHCNQGVIIGVASALFVLLLTAAYNYFLKEAESDG